MENVSGDLFKFQDTVEALNTDVAKLAVENSKLKDEVKKTNVNTEEARSNFVRKQGSFIQDSLYKIIRPKAFGAYVNRCDMSLTLVASTDAVELICFNFPNLNIKKDICGYDVEARRAASHHITETMMRVPKLPVFSWLRAYDHPLSIREILASEVDEDTAFKELD